MAKDRNGSTHEGEEEDRREESKRDRHRKSKRKKDESSSSDGSSDSEDVRKKKKKRGSRSSRRRRRDSSESVEGSSSDSFSDSGSESDCGDESELESEELRRRKRKERRREREHEKERKRRKEREREKKRKRDKEKRRKKTDKDKSKKNKEKDLGKTGAVTNSWGKYGIIRETDMWNKRPEFTAWLAEVKKVNLESLANWEEKQMFKEFMEDHNTATFPSKKYYDLDVYYRRKIEKEIKKGYKKASATERTVFNDEEQRRQELLIERERQKEEQVETLKRNMQSGMAQAMKEQARLREEMAYQYKLGNFEAAAAIQRRLDPDVAM
ncbi:hypothetical protein J5N97_016317 [Dioscorea zingiberensis]|uniref:Uncharacterized protein n=1 Tax=Dioscorea zingiberensis TaxID=325984 RepID=A0A9D5CKT1_9LILI|nr:hypothetical protein J5N97_016317 [Dioscorea zingiberensis]